MEIMSNQSRAQSFEVNKLQFKSRYQQILVVQNDQALNHFSISPLSQVCLFGQGYQQDISWPSVQLLLVKHILLFAEVHTFLKVRVVHLIACWQSTMTWHLLNLLKYCDMMNICMCQKVLILFPQVFRIFTCVEKHQHSIDESRALEEFSLKTPIGIHLLDSEGITVHFWRSQIIHFMFIL